MTTENCARCGNTVYENDDSVRIKGGIYYHNKCWNEKKDDLSEDEIEELKKWEN